VVLSLDLYLLMDMLLVEDLKLDMERDLSLMGKAPEDLKLALRDMAPEPDQLHLVLT